MPIMATAVAQDEDWAKAVDDQEGNKLSNQVRVDKRCQCNMPMAMAMELAIAIDLYRSVLGL